MEVAVCFSNYTVASVRQLIQLTILLLYSPLFYIVTSILFYSTLTIP